MSTDQSITLGAHILMVDDTPMNLKYLKMILTEYGYRVQPLSESSQAFSIAQENSPDLILLDINMPGMSGYDLCQKLKTDQRTRDIPVIFVSSSHEALDKVRAFFVGGIDYITRPFQPEELLARIETHLTLRNLQRNLQQKNTLLQREIAEREQIEKSLKESEERYRKLVQLSPDAIVVHQAGTLVYLNDAGARLFGVAEPDELIGKHLSAAVHLNAQSIAERWAEKTYVEGELTPLIEEQFMRLDGQKISVEIAGAPILYRGTPSTQLVIRDITRRKHTEQLLHESEQKYYSIFENATTGIFQSTLHGKFMAANLALARMLGYESAEDLVQSVTNIAEQVYVEPQHWYDITGMLQIIHEPAKVETRCRCKDGREIFVNLNVWARRDAQDKVSYFEGFFEDITERKHMEEALVRERNLLSTLINSSPDFIYVKDHEFRFLLANRAVVQSLGVMNPDDLWEKTDFDFYPMKQAEQYHTNERTVLETGQVLMNCEESIVDQESHSLKWFLTTNVPLQDTEGNTVGLVGIKRDITERKQAERVAFQQTTLLQSAAKAMTVLLVEPIFRTAITQALELLGFATEADRIYIFENHPHPETGEPLMSQRFEWVIDASEAQIDNPTLQNLAYHPRFSRWYEILNSKRSISGLVRDFPQSERELLETQNILSIMIVPIIFQDTFWGFIGLHACHTERQWKKEEESLLFAMAGSIGGAIVRQQARDRLIAANDELMETLDHLKHTQTQLVISESMAALGQLIAGVAHEINTPLSAIRSSVGNLSTALERTLQQLPGFFQTLSEDRQQEFLALLNRILPQDITLSDEKTRELKRTLSETLKQTSVPDVPKTIDILVSMGIYDNIQPLLPLLQDANHLHILNMAYQLSGLRESAHIIMIAAERAAKVVTALKTYAHHSDEMIKAEIIEGIETVLILHYNQYKHGVEVIRHYEEIEPILCYPDKLNQVWTNLIHNALQAMNYKGMLTIGVRKKEKHVVVSITDTGSGIPEEIKDKTFEPFFTTRPTGEGSGLGLDIAKKIITQHRGKITFESAPGNTTFYVWLPIQGKTKT